MLQTRPQSNARPLLIHARPNLCAIKEASRILGKKWYLVVIHNLMGKRMGFNELKDAVGDISAKILSQALQDLQSKGVVSRTLASTTPLRVEYRLTDKGADLAPFLTQLQEWGKRWDICKDAAEHKPNTQGPVHPEGTVSPLGAN